MFYFRISKKTLLKVNQERIGKNFSAPENYNDLQSLNEIYTCNYIALMIL